MNARTLGFGIAFGFVLSRAGATDFDAIRGMFLLTDLHLFGVIGTAVALCALGFAWLRRTHAHSQSGEPISLASKPMTPTLVAGAVLFGVGWALSGTCPGTAIAQLGEGRLAALATFGGMLVGAFLAERIAARGDARAESRESQLEPITRSA